MSDVIVRDEEEPVEPATGTARAVGAPRTSRGRFWLRLRKNRLAIRLPEPVGRGGAERSHGTR